MHAKRKKPFSAKQKKTQMQERRAKKAEQKKNADPSEFFGEHHINQQNIDKQNTNASNSRNKLSTIFDKEPQELIEKRKKEAMKPLKRINKFPVSLLYGERLDIPVRPPWTYDTSKEELEQNEKNYYQQWLNSIYDRYPKERLNFFEQNLEVWRQLWRVCEISDILLVLADIRHPIFHFPPSLYRYVVKTLKKPMILVLTKADLVPEENILLWQTYFKDTFPELKVTYCFSFKGLGPAILGKRRRLPKSKRKRNIEGVTSLIDLLNEFIVQNGGSPLSKSDEFDIEEEIHNEETKEDKITDNEQISDAEIEEEKSDEIIQTQEEENHYEIPQKRDYLTIGLIGHPNVGKSTLINTLKGKKVCSTSRTPGHTKYKQTIFLNPTVMLCDCPGLVFPAIDIPKQLQVLCGLFPIAQVREPYSSIQYLAERVPIEKIYNLQKVYTETDWSAFEIAEAYAEKRGYHTTRGRSDAYRAGIELLKDHCDGKIILYFLPNSSKINLSAYENDNVENKMEEQNEDEEQEYELDIKMNNKISQEFMENYKEKEIQSDLKYNTRRIDRRRKQKKMRKGESVSESSEEEYEKPSKTTGNMFSLLGDE